MDGFLAEGLDRMNAASVTVRELKGRFDRAMEINFKLFGPHSFRKSLTGPVEGNRSVLNIALFDVCSVLLGQADSETVWTREERVREAIENLVEDPGFAHAITYSTNSRKQVHIRFERFEAELGKALA
jgi:hypothetical protein